MTDPIILNPHDRFVKLTFGRIPLAKGFFAQYLPTAVLKEIDLDARGMEELVEAPEALKRYVPRMPLELYDLCQYTDDELRGEAVLQAHLLLLKYITSHELPQRLPGIMRLLAELLDQPNGMECVKAVLRYVSVGTDQLTETELIQAVTIGFPSKGSTLMPTIAEQWVQEGFEKGIEKGLSVGQLIGRIQTLQEMLGKPMSTTEELSNLALPQLEELARNLREDRMR